MILHLLLARAFVSCKRFEEAQLHITEIGSISTCAAKVAVLQANILCNSGQRDKARFVLESIASDAKDAEVWLTLAKLHRETNEQDKVLTDLMEVNC